MGDNLFRLDLSGDKPKIKTSYDTRNRHEVVLQLIGNFIKNRRLELKFEIEEVAEYSKISKKILLNVENGIDTDFRNYLDYISYFGGRLFIEWKEFLQHHTDMSELNKRIDNLE